MSSPATVFHITLEKIFLPQVIVGQGYSSNIPTYNSGGLPDLWYTGALKITPRIGNDVMVNAKKVSSPQTDPAPLLT